MKDSRRYRYLVPVLLLLLIIVPIIGYKNKKLSASVTITESSTNAIDENRNYLSESDNPEEEMESANAETLKKETEPASAETLEEETGSASPETEVQTETEMAHAIEGIPGYEYLYEFPVDIVFASQESVELLTDIYEKIGFEGEFQSGDKTVYDFYRKKFALLLDGKVKIYDPEGNESLLYDRYTSMGCSQIDIQGGDELYFFDMDGDGFPELCVQGTSGTYICKYNAESDQYTEWWGATDSGYRILGTRKIAADNCGDTEYLFLLDKDGYTECEITFNISYYQTEKLYLVSVPDFEERVRDEQIPDSMKQQMVYDEFTHTYYLRVTREQYKELIKGLYEARESAKKEQVPFSYFFDSEV